MAISYVLQISYFAMYNHGHTILRLFYALPIIFFFHHKWNEAGLLVINTEVTTCPTTYVLGS